MLHLVGMVDLYFVLGRKQLCNSTVASDSHSRPFIQHRLLNSVLSAVRYAERVVDREEGICLWNIVSNSGVSLLPLLTLLASQIWLWRVLWTSTSNIASEGTELLWESVDATGLCSPDCTSKSCPSRFNLLTQCNRRFSLVLHYHSLNIANLLYLRLQM